MLTHKSNLVAIVVGGLYNPFYTAVLEQFTVRLQAAGHQVLLVHVASDHALDEVIPKLASYRVDESSAPLRSSRQVRRKPWPSSEFR